MMLVIVWEEGRGRKELDIQGEKLLHIRSWLRRNERELWGRLEETPYKYVVGRQDDSLKPIQLYPQMAETDLSSYDLLVIAEDVKGEAVFTALAGAISTAVAAAAGIAATSAVALAVGYVVAAVVLIGISYALGQIIQLLSPSQKVTGENTTDAAIAQKNMLFNGVQNIREQGGGVPLVFGECLVGGVVVSVRIGTSEDFGTGKQVLSMVEAMNAGNEGKWLWLAKV